MNRLLNEGGPYKTKKTGSNEYSMTITIPPDEDGRIARECPDDSCSPGYFKVKPGTGITEGQTEAYCPYCCRSDIPNNFQTKEQLRFAKDIVTREAHKSISNIIGNALGFGSSTKKQLGGGFLSIEMSYKPGALPLVRPPTEEALKRDIICPHCGLDHSVYGLATWCPDCGKDIFVIHLQQEYSVIRKMLSDGVCSKKEYGERIAARYIENALEDVVSIFEAVLKTELPRFLRQQGTASDEAEIILKKIGNGFQNITRATRFYQEELGIELFANFSPDKVEKLRQIFEKRHPITHNLGIVDKKYLERAKTREREGREVSVSESDVMGAIDFSYEVLSALHKRLFDAIG